MPTTIELQQQINQAEAKVNELREKLTQQQNVERVQAIASAKELIKTYQLSATDLGFAAKKPTPSVKRARIDKGVAIAPKYADPSTGKTWSGRGKAPAWLITYLSAGHSKQDYLISNKQ
ncbi:MAG: H-NS histone family protein [Polaromonas sp.]|uniref:H-NS histone family protein n=1 Tax=Polaromonas sp. TaxID=1869339 RepID=UPI002732F5C2|nr:H-NS histone family protein [Polaromonas sp.]MDP2819179.1 H-NS histone family protein [Polaromonas sp.]